MSNPFTAVSPVSAAEEDLNIRFVPEKKEQLEYNKPYSAKLTTIEKQTSSTGNPMLVCQFALTEGAQTGRTFTDRVPCGVPWRVQALAEALGAPMTADANGNQSANFKGTVGKSVSLTFYEDVYNGKSFPKIAKVLPPTANSTPAAASGPRIA